MHKLIDNIIPVIAGRRTLVLLPLLISLLFSFLPLSAQISRPSSLAPRSSSNDSVLRSKASLITCWPGSEVYELCGHSALRIQAEGTDSVWNYGVFDFAEPNFVYRFVKGETDYMLAGYPFSWFMPDYVKHGRTVVEQDLNLSDAQVRQLRHLLQKEALPQNRLYRYNYIRDNCATRILDRVRETVGDSIIFRSAPAHDSFRDAMRDFHRNYPWYQFGIDIALGQGLDGEMTVAEETFAPTEMYRILQQSTFTDGRPVVSAERVLYQGDESAAVLPPTPWYLTPLAAAVVVLLFSLGACIWSYRTRRLPRWWYSLFFGLEGVAGCIVAFLVFVSEHEATSPNLLIYWLNPLQLVLAACVWSQRTRPAAIAMAWINILAVGLLLVCWPFQVQSANPAFFPLMAADLILAITYAIIAPSKSYKNNEPPRNLSHMRTRGGQRRSSRRPDAPKARGRNRR